MTLERYETLIKETLGDKIDFAGETLYSSIKTLEKSDIYLLGTNPGGEDKWTIKKDLEKLKNRPLDYNEFFDGVWPNGKNNNPPAGEENLQKKMKSFFENIEYDLKKVCSSNLIFFTSSNVQKILKKFETNFNGIADICWPVHEETIKRISPKIVIGYGNGESNSPYSYLKRKYNIKDENVVKIKTGHGEYYAKIFEHNGIQYIFIPHLSQFVIKNNKIFLY